jgi:hypothetical protein
MINFVNEFIYFDGKRIPNRDDVKSASNSTTDPIFNPEDGEQLKNATAQQRQQGYRGYYSLVPMPAVKTPLADDSYPTMVSYMDDEKNIRNFNKNKLKNFKVKRRIKEVAKNKIDNMIEDIVNKKIAKDILNVRKNGIPDIDVVSEENPILVRKLKNLVDIVDLNQATGEQKGVILNFLINNIGTVDIPVEYKEEIVKKLK